METDPRYGGLMASGWQACAAIVEKGDPDRFASAMAAPVTARQNLFPIYAFNVEVARAPWVTQEPMIAEMRLQWWRDALEEIAGGGPVRRHEVVSPLAEVLSPALARMLDGLVAERHWDIQRAPFADRAEFDGYIGATAGHLMWAAAAALGATEEAAVRDVAYGAGVAQFLQAVPDLESRGRIPLVDGRPEAVKALAQEALIRLRRGRARRPVGEARWALMAAWQAEALLKQAVADPRRVAAGALGLSEFRKRAGLLVRALTGRH